METYELASLLLAGGGTTRPVPFGQAKLVVVTEYGTRHWYVDIDGIADEALLREYASAERIDVDIVATTIGGKKLSGRGYFHPNPAVRAAAIRGVDALNGYAAPGQRS